MKTQSTTKTKSTKAVKTDAIGSPAASKSVQTVSNEVPYTVHTSWRLKRSKQRPGTEYVAVTAVMDIDQSRALNMLGIKLGVTSDEIINGLISRELLNLNGTSDLSHFIPVLN